MSASGPSTTKQSASQTTQSTTGAASPTISGNKNAVNLGTQVDFSGTKGNITLNSLDAGLAESAVDRAFNFAGAAAAEVSKLFASSADRSAASASSNNALLSGALANFADLGKTGATGGQSDTNKTFLYLGIAAALVVGVLIYKR